MYISCPTPSPTSAPFASGAAPLPTANSASEPNSGSGTPQNRLMLESEDQTNPEAADPDPTPDPTAELTPTPIAGPVPTNPVTADPTPDPTAAPTPTPTAGPDPSNQETADPTPDPTAATTPTPIAGSDPSNQETADPTLDPTAATTLAPISKPTATPTVAPTADPLCKVDTVDLKFYCKVCSAGYYKATSGSDSCSPCAEGKYVSSTGATACLLCETGVPNAGRTACESEESSTPSDTTTDTGSTSEDGNGGEDLQGFSGFGSFEFDRLLGLEGYVLVSPFAMADSDHRLLQDGRSQCSTGYTTPLPTRKPTSSYNPTPMPTTKPTFTTRKPTTPVAPTPEPTTLAPSAAPTSGAVQVELGLAIAGLSIPSDEGALAALKLSLRQALADSIGLSVSDVADPVLVAVAASGLTTAPSAFPTQPSTKPTVTPTPKPTVTPTPMPSARPTPAPTPEPTESADTQESRRRLMSTRKRDSFFPSPLRAHEQSQSAAVADQRPRPRPRRLEDTGGVLVTFTVTTTASTLVAADSDGAASALDAISNSVDAGSFTSALQASLDSSGLDYSITVLTVVATDTTPTAAPSAKPTSAPTSTVYYRLTVMFTFTSTVALSAVSTTEQWQMQTAIKRAFVSSMTTSLLQLTTSMLSNATFSSVSFRRDRGLWQESNEGNEEGGVGRARVGGDHRRLQFSNGIQVTTYLTVPAAMTTDSSSGAAATTISAAFNAASSTFYSSYVSGLVAAGMSTSSNTYSYFQAYGAVSSISTQDSSPTPIPTQFPTYKPTNPTPQPSDAPVSEADKIVSSLPLYAWILAPVGLALLASWFLYAYLRQKNIEKKLEKRRALVSKGELVLTPEELKKREMEEVIRVTLVRGLDGALGLAEKLAEEGREGSDDAEGSWWSRRWAFAKVVGKMAETESSNNVDASSARGDGKGKGKGRGRPRGGEGEEKEEGRGQEQGLEEGAGLLLAEIPGSGWDSADDSDSGSSGLSGWDDDNNNRSEASSSVDVGGWQERQAELHKGRDVLTQALAQASAPAPAQAQAQSQHALRPVNNPHAVKVGDILLYRVSADSQPVRVVVTEIDRDQLPTVYFTVAPAVGAAKVTKADKLFVAPSPSQTVLSGMLMSKVADVPHVSESGCGDVADGGSDVRVIPAAAMLEVEELVELERLKEGALAVQEQAKIKAERKAAKATKKATKDIVIVSPLSFILPKPPARPPKIKPLKKGVDDSDMYEVL